MATLLQIRDACKRFGDQILLDGASVTLTDDAKVGFIGRNGSGKTTLCSVIMERAEFDAGEVLRFPGLRLGYLRQDDPFQPGETVLAFLLRDSGAPDWRCAEVAARFEMKGPMLDTPVAALSGGWQTRLKLASLLLHDPNLLLLDEPTNFLDLRTQMLLERFLKDFKGGCLIVSHDRGFLGATCDRTLELARGRLTLFPGPVDGYIEHKAKRREHDEKVNAVTLAKRRHLQDFIDRNRARPQTASQARSKKKQLDRLELIEIEEAESVARIRVPVVDPRQGPALRCENLAIGYPDKTVARGIDLEVTHGSRVVVVGDNGQGKTTFLRTLAGLLNPRAGHVARGHAVDLGYYAQLVYNSLSETGTVTDYLERRTSIATSPQVVRGVAGSFLFGGDEAEKPVSVLSGGERARLCLAGLLLGGHNVLVLDEPGNHLDVDSVEALAEGLMDYQGTLVFTSHDRHFMRRVATAVIEVRDGRVAHFPGGYDAYLYHVTREIEEGEGLPAAPAVPASVPPPDKEQRKAAARERYRLLKEASTLERQMNRLDERLRGLDEALLMTADLETSQRLHGEIVALKAELSDMEDRWLAMQERIEAHKDDG